MPSLLFTPEEVGEMGEMGEMGEKILPHLLHLLQACTLDQPLMTALLSHSSFGHLWAIAYGTSVSDVRSVGASLADR